MNNKLPTRAGFPNYTAAISQGAGSFTADQSYYIVIQKNNAGNNSAYLTINGRQVAALEGSSQGYNRTFACAYCYKGDTVKVQLNNSSCVKYPLR